MGNARFWYGAVLIRDADGKPLAVSLLANPYFFTARRFDTDTSLMLAGFFHGIVHDRKLMREPQVNLAMRWVAASLLDMEQRFKRIMGYQQLWVPDAKLKDLNEQTGIDEKLQAA